MDYAGHPRPRFFAHRGGSLESPENTLEAFRHGIAAGADHLELDVHASSDGTIVVFHDPTLERTTNGSGELRQHTFAQLRELDAGYQFVDEKGTNSFRGRGLQIPTLAEVCQEFPDVPLNMEIKQAEPDIVQDVMAVLAGEGALGRSLVAAEHKSLMDRIRLESSGVLLGYATEDVVSFLEAMEAGELDSYEPVGFALQVPSTFLGTPLVTAEFVAGAHSRGLEVHVWTVDDRDEMEQLLALGVDGLMTDRPTLLAEVLSTWESPSRG
ncbi:MAG: glycerophosphodiester phosphodiesterase [Candidatus Binatia bacterium]|nr:glycerophosphodiester phosphodiesterase [Candidatus Binatia bacterium]MDG2010369.1 glycerophosphodiester phosphodiesterase [Candidatus Binatia bacterium]